jgi:hypothetical protein
LHDITSQKGSLEEIERLSSAVAQTADAVIVKGLCHTAQRYEAKRPQTDDMTVVICKAEAAP